MCTGEVLLRQSVRYVEHHVMDGTTEHPAVRESSVAARPDMDGDLVEMYDCEILDSGAGLCGADPELLFQVCSALRRA